MAGKVLTGVTGLSGLIGSILRSKLVSHYEVSALNRSAVDQIPTTQADAVDRFSYGFVIHVATSQTLVFIH